MVIDQTLEYLRESLSNYIESDICQQIYQKLEQGHYENEADFMEYLNEEELAYLNAMLEREINYAKNVQNNTRVDELNEVFDLLS